MMDAHRSPTRRVVISGSDGRTGSDLERVPFSPPTAAADYRPINGAFADNGKPAGPSSTFKRGTRAASHPAARASGTRTSMLQSLIDLIGHDGAARLIEAFGGTPVYVPQAPEPADTLSTTIGHLRACALAQIFGGDRLEVPNPPPRRARILALRANGLTINAIARTLSCTRRRVFQVIAEARANDRDR